MLNRSITLNGIFTASKSSMGKRVAKILGVPFIDTDDLIIEHFKDDFLDDPDWSRLDQKRRLHKINEKIGNAVYLIVENAVGVLAAHRQTPHVFAVGGSMVFCEQAMGCFARYTDLWLLDVSKETVERRIVKHPNRAIIKRPGQSIGDVYDERMPNYRKWAHPDRTFNADNDDRWRLAYDFVARLQQRIAA